MTYGRGGEEFLLPVIGNTEDCNSHHFGLDLKVIVEERERI
jgi:hypothetical protein